MGDGEGNVNDCLDYDDIFEEDLPIGKMINYLNKSFPIVTE